MELRITIFLMFFSSFVWSQIDTKDIIKPRKKFHSINLQTQSSPEEITINKKDTLGVFKTSIKNLNYLKDTIINNDYLINTYKRSVFNYSDVNSEHVYYLRQWGAPVIIYFDKGISNNIIKNIKKFYSQITEIENLKISFTNKINEANYYVRTTHKNINVDIKHFIFNDKTQKKRFIFSNCNYNLIFDDTKKSIGCILEINTNNIEDELTIETNLKQAIFLSLGRFFIQYYTPVNAENSLLNTIYINEDEIRVHDLELLKMHYGQVYNQKINGTLFNNLLKLKNTTNEN